MDEYLTLFDTQAEYEAAKDSLELPNASYVRENETVYYHPYEEPAIPVISGDDTFTGTTQVTMSCETAGTTIHYTTDGSNPTLNSTVYTEPITLSTTTTVKAISAKANVKSEAASKDFTLLVAPVISGSEIFTGTTEVTITCETAGAAIYYTTDGSTPTTESTEYESAIMLSADATVKAISVKGGVSSSVTSKAFSVLEAPIISGNTTFEDTTEVTITCETVGASIYYTLDGTTPTTSSAEYTAAITLSATTTVKAIAVVSATSSTVASQTFSFIGYSREYLTFVSKADNNTIGWKASSSSNLKRIYVSTDNGQTWTNKTSMQSTSGMTLATLNNGDKLLIKGSNTTYGASKYYNYFTATQNFDIEGNIMSLLYGDNFIGETSLSGKDYAFRNLFYNNTYVVNAQNLKLPATTLATCCYEYMFSGCTLLTSAPELLATTLASCCYYGMFENCTSLTAAPELPSITLASSCYSYMFRGCTSLTTAPTTLPSITLASSCYNYMFYGCTSLTTAPTLPATTLADNCYECMFSGCRGLATAPATLPATTLANKCYLYMFKDCTSLTSAPILPATTLADRCYSSMFYGCTGLTIAPALPATTLAERCYAAMFAICTSLTTAPTTLPATTLANYCYQSMFVGCTSLNYIKCLATDISATDCTENWVYNVAATGTFVKDPSMSGWATGNSGIPSGWTVEDAS